MSRGKFVIVLVLTSIIAIASNASARSSYHIGFNVGPTYPAPVYHYPAYPVYPVAPVPVYHPRPVYVAPAPVPVWGSGFSFGFSSR